MKDIEPLLRELATKLGTTADHIWSILLRQAIVSATESFVFVILTIALAFLLFRLHIKYSKQSKKEGETYSRCQYDRDDAVGVIMGVSGGLWLIMMIVSIFCFVNMFNGYFNPEYWALNEIMEAIK